MGQALYRKYRSKKLNEIVGQKAVTTALENALKSGQISHAYLFTGPRGVGKTSIARILAYEINELPYTSDELPIDIIEIDAASNRRIDEIRDLREKVRIAPISAKYKVYIIDEVHMLTREAFNALLKTLEEPPAHVIFILATTEAHKLPETIVSRTQRYTFKLATQEEVAQHLTYIAKQENVDIDNDAIQLLAKHSGGSLRDALSLLDQVRHSAKKITADIVRQNLGLPSDTVIEALLASIKNDQPQSVMTALEQTRADGSSATLIAEQLIQTLRDQLTQGDRNTDIDATVKLCQSLLLVESSARPDIQLELTLIGAQLQSNNHPQRPIVSEAHIQATQPPLTISQPAQRPAKKKQTVADSEQVAKPATATERTNVQEPAGTQAPNQNTMTPELWPDVLDTLRKTHNTLYSVLRMATPDFDNIAGHQLQLFFKFPFHQKRMNEAKNKQIIADALASLGVSGYEITCQLIPKNSAKEIQSLNSDETANEPPVKQDTALLGQIRSVFGGAEVLE